MPSNERVLVVAAHCDDEAFGCLGALLKHKDAGSEFAFLWFAQSRKTYKGAKSVRDFFKAKYSAILAFADQRLDVYSLNTVLSPIEIALKEFKPTFVYTNFIGDLNKDHRLVSEATMVACRPYKPNAPKEVWMYEIPGTTELGFRPFIRDKTIEVDKRKYELIKKWYPKEMINGRDWYRTYLEEHFERWPA